MSVAPHRTAGGRDAAAERRRVRSAGVAALALILVTVASFGGLRLFSSPYTIRGEFASSNDLLPGSDVRIAGVDVGHVTGVARGPDNTSIVSMAIDSGGQPIHADATLAILPRLVLEGNFYVRIDPGTPSSPVLRSGGLIPERHTSVPVQIDQVLDTFDLPTRDALQQSIRGLAAGLGAAPRSTGGSGARPALAGYQGLRRAVRALNTALPPVAAFGQAAQGTEAGDVGHAIVYARDFTSELASNPSLLADLVTSFNTVASALASGDGALGSSIEQLDRSAQAAPPAFTALDRALPMVTSFSRTLTPALRDAPAPLAGTASLLAELRTLMGPGELPSAITALEPVAHSLPQLEQRLRPLLPLVTDANQCLSGHVAWALDQRLQDGPNTTGDPTYLDLLHAVAGLVAATGGFDGNGRAVRLGVTEGASIVEGTIPGLGAFAGFAPQLLGARPEFLGDFVVPPFRPDVRCSTDPRPQMQAPSGPPMSIAHILSAALGSH